ncbi:MAG: PEP-CTERM/exosortase system-associated acyltransferase [Azoarcus sp.]|nr:PEP-CTERM/exosortase system-associated acyltransferase [Azoarcus sp.]
MNLLERFNLGHGFDKRFEAVPATTETLRRDVFRLRHEVYCEELKYEPEHADRLESDKYDAGSLHCLIRASSPDIQPAGCVRLILTRADEPAAPLPIETICARALDRSIIDPQKLARARIAEISRLAIHPAFRRRGSDGRLPVAINAEDFSLARGIRFPYIQLGLYLSAVALAKHHGIASLFVLTEPRLAAYFAKLGVNIRRIGGPVEHHGIRVPSLLEVQGVIDGMSSIVKPMWQVIENSIARGFAAENTPAKKTA